MHSRIDDLFSDHPERMDGQTTDETVVSLGPGASLLHGFALPYIESLLASIDAVTTAVPFRHMVTTRGFRMSVAMSNCGTFGWISDRRGYRYVRVDPLTGKLWPAMPGVLVELAERAADSAGFPGFRPDACLINRYDPGARMGLHQDRDETDFRAPIVSVSLGLPATFLFGGEARSDRPQRVLLHHGDVVVWGGPARLFHHGIAALADGHHQRLGPQRINLTLRRAGEAAGS